MKVAYRVTIYRDAEKELRQVPRDDVKRIVSRIGRLAGDLRPLGSDKLSTLDRYRIRQGNWRILYEVDDHNREVTVVRIAHRREAYRR